VSKTLEPSSFIDSASFVLPPKVAKLDAVRKLIPRLMEVTGLGETAATTIAHSVVDPTAVRTALAEPLPGLTAHRHSHLQVIPTRVWTPWLTPPADDIARYSTQKTLPIADPTVPRTSTLEESRDGLALNWKTVADREWHLKDNRQIYAQDIHRDSLRIFPEKGGIITPLVLAPQTEHFQDGGESLNLLRVADGRYRYYGVLDLLDRYADLDQIALDGHFGPDVITPETLRAALGRDRIAFGKVINAVRDACIRIGYGEDHQQYIGVHYLASILSLPAYIAVGTVDPVTSEVRPMGADRGYPAGVGYTLSHGVGAWHTGNPARVVVTGQREFNGLLLPEASVDTGLIDVATKRLRVRGVGKNVIEAGEKGRLGAAARFVWWCRAIGQLGGTPATAVAAFARHTVNEGPWPQAISQALLACASHLMEEDRDVVYPAGDHRDAERRPDSLSLLVADAKNLTPIAALDVQGYKLLAHPRWRNAAHIALAHLALVGALPAEDPLPGQVLNPHLLSGVALAWANNKALVLTRADGTLLRDDEGRAIPIDGRTLSQVDPPWIDKMLFQGFGYMQPPTTASPIPGASHIFKIRHDVVYTIPSEPLDEDVIEATPEALAKVVRRWFPDATGIVLTDWSDKFITGLMVGSVYVRLFDRRGEMEDARRRGVWYPEGRPLGTKDIVDFDSVESGAPVGTLFSTGDWLVDTVSNGVGVDMVAADEAWYQELDGTIIQEVDDALEIQKAADIKAGNKPDTRWEVPVLRLPEIKRHKS
jgi:hypothetical protein